jgi:hypothetical protein
MIKKLLKDYYKLELKQLKVTIQLMLEIAKYKKATISLGTTPTKLINCSQELIIENGEFKIRETTRELFVNKINIDNEKKLIKHLVDQYRTNPRRGIEEMHKLIKEILKGGKNEA